MASFKLLFVLALVVAIAAAEHTCQCACQTKKVSGEIRIGYTAIDQEQSCQLQCDRLACMKFCAENEMTVLDANCVESDMWSDVRKFVQKKFPDGIPRNATSLSRFFGAAIVEAATMQVATVQTTNQTGTNTTNPIINAYSEMFNFIVEYSWVFSIIDTLIALPLGIVLLLIGYRFFKFCVAIVGFVFGFVFTWTLCVILMLAYIPTLSTWISMLIAIIPAFIVACICAVIAFYVYLIGVFLMGCCCGCLTILLCVTFILAIFFPSGNIPGFFGLIIFLSICYGPCVFGVVAVLLAKPVIVVCTSFIGADMLAGIESTWLGPHIGLGNAWITLAIVIILTPIGICFQYWMVPRFLPEKHNDETHPMVFVGGQENQVYSPTEVYTGKAGY